MPKTKKKTKSKSKVNTKSKVAFKLHQSWASIFIGAIVIVILGLLVASILTKNNGQIDDEASRTDQSSNSVETIAKEGGKYKIVSGDSLSAISMKYYNTFDYWPVLAKINNIANPNLISADMELNIPSKAEIEKTNTEMTIKIYEIQKDDTLFAISEKVYGDGSKWRIIARANKVGYLPNGNPLIFAGNKLSIPR